MNPTILNRDFKHPIDGWYHIEPKGEHPNRSRNVTQIIDDDACQAIVNRFNADADAGQLSHGHEMLIDHEHFKHDADKETIAYGWLQRLQNRADGIYGQVRWSATGQKAVDGGDYRFFSTEYDPKDLQAVPGSQPSAKTKNREDQKMVRPLRLDGLSLTNEPNNKGARPITNRQRQRDAEPHQPSATDLETFERAAGESPRGRVADTFVGASASAANKQTNNQVKNRNMKSIAQKLGLAAEASEDAVLEAVTKLMNRNATLEPLATENTTLKNRLTELDAANVDALLAGHGVKDAKVLNRMKPILLSTPANDRQACLEELLPKAPGVAATGATAPAARSQTKLFNRNTTAPDLGKSAEESTGLPDKATAQKIMNRATEIKKELHVSDATAVSMAQRELQS